MAAAGTIAKSEIALETESNSVAGTKENTVIQSSELSGSEEEGLDNFGDNVFKDPAVAQHWREVYEKSTYECRHVFDPSLTWSEEEEKRLVRKLDWRVCLWAVGHPPC